ncbi:hypothetical protein QQP08_019846 [Theobroma cacao]|nr:hypothetical protein QQP08_019846 [Theobroma cacao]
MTADLYPLVSKKAHYQIQYICSHYSEQHEAEEIHLWQRQCGPHSDLRSDSHQRELPSETGQCTELHRHSEGCGGR